MFPPTKKIEKLRRKIDETDKKIAKLLRQRKKTVKQIQKLKLENKLPVSDKTREKEILSKFKTPYEQSIFKEIISQSKKQGHTP